MVIDILPTFDLFVGAYLANWVVRGQIAEANL